MTRSSDDQTKRIQENEAEVISKRVLQDSLLLEDENAARVRWVLAHQLVYVADDPNDKYWTRLYLDPSDGRYWERTFLQGELHGGGPPTLIHLTREDAEERYNLTLPLD